MFLYYRNSKKFSKISRKSKYLFPVDFFNDLDKFNKPQTQN